MTEEHLPPKSAGNADPITIYNEQDGAVTVLRSYQRGHTVPSLCLDCNGGASKRGLPQAYALWRKDVFGSLGQAGAALHAARGCNPNDLWWLVKSPTEAFWLPIEHGKGINPAGGVSLHPGRIVRQILGMFLAVQANRRLRDEHPELQAAYISQNPTALTGHSVHVALGDTGTLGYLTDAAVAVSLDLSGQKRAKATPFWTLVFKPFIITLCEGTTAPMEAARIDHWLSYPDNGNFTKAGRHVAYPIALRGSLFVRFLHQRGDRLPQA